jgi:hypothetical protein
MDLYLNLMPDLRNVVLSYFGDAIFSQGDKAEFPQAQDEATFATAEEFRKSQAIDCIFINYKITSTDHIIAPDTLLRCSGVPKIKTHALYWMMFCNSKFNGDISQWDIFAVADIESMCYSSKFKKETVQSWNNFKNHNINEIFR